MTITFEVIVSCKRMGKRKQAKLAEEMIRLAEKVAKESNKGAQVMAVITEAKP